MGAWRHPARAVMEDVAAILESKDIESPASMHKFGAKGRALFDAPNRYVWVPFRLQDKNDTPSRMVEEVRTLFSTRLVIEIDCWGSDDDHVWAMANNLLAAMNESTRADLDLLNAEMVRPGEAQNQRGECMRVTVSVGVPFIDAYISLATMLEPEADTFIAARIEGDIHLSPSTEENGEHLVTVTT